jgi:hypothetical protein
MANGCATAGRNTSRETRDPRVFRTRSACAIGCESPGELELGDHFARVSAVFLRATSIIVSEGSR